LVVIRLSKKHNTVPPLRTGEQKDFEKKLVRYHQRASYSQSVKTIGTLIKGKYIASRV